MVSTAGAFLLATFANFTKAYTMFCCLSSLIDRQHNSFFNIDVFTRVYVRKKLNIHPRHFYIFLKRTKTGLYCCYLIGTENTPLLAWCVCALAKVLALSTIAKTARSFSVCFEYVCKRVAMCYVLFFAEKSLYVHREDGGHPPRGGRSFSCLDSEFFITFFGENASTCP